MPKSDQPDQTKPTSQRAVEPITMRVPEACRFIGIGRSTLYVLIAQGEIETVKLGASTLVLTESLRSLVEERRASLRIAPESTRVSAGLGR